MKSIAGKSPDRMLAAGIYGHQYAQCVELMRDYPAFGARNLTLAQNLLVNVYWPANKFFLDTHLGNSNTTFWANWDLGNMATALSIGIVADRRDIYDYALNYFYNGNGTGAINHFLWKVYGDGMAQGNEVGLPFTTATDIRLGGTRAIPCSTSRSFSHSQWQRITRARISGPTATI